MIKQILTGLILLNSVLIHSQSLTQSEIKDYILRMIPQNYSINLIKISEPVNNYQIALIDLPYREFPSILIFKFNNKTKKWDRTFEGLCPGIQDNPSGLLDWHTLGLGIDFMIDKDTVFELQDDKVKTMVDAMNQNKGILIPYQHFLHMHTADSIPTDNFEPYTIDKTRYYDFALQLFGKLYTKYPKQECMMFDSPKTIDFKIEFTDEHYKITALTANKQIWTYIFRGSDEANKYLIDKQITINNAR